MKRIRRIFVFVFSFVILTLTCINVQAASTMNVVVEQDKQEIKSGESLTLTLRFDNYEVFDNGLNAYKATLVYNRDVFEVVHQENFQTQNNWERLRFNEETGEFVSIKKKGSKSSESLVILTLKAKEDIKAGEEKIIFKDVVTSEGKKDIPVLDGQVKVDIIQQQNLDNSTEDNENKSSEILKENKKNDDKNQNTIISSKNAGSIFTGDTTNWLFWIFLVVFEIGILIYFIKKNNKGSVQNRKIFLIIAVCIISLQTVMTTVFAAMSYSSKGELNADGEVDYSDVELLEQFLIHQGSLTDDALKNADMNSDGKITVTDLTLLVQKIEKKTEYTVSLSEAAQDTYYPQKNQNVTLKFYATVSPDAKIEKAIINDQEYVVDGGNGTYMVEVGKESKAGIKKYHFTEVILNNGKKVVVDFTIKLDVLKSMPSIGNYLVEEDVKTLKHKISFNLQDEDESITSAILEIHNENDEVIQQENISVGNNKIDIRYEEGKKYTAQFFISYDLDSGKLKDHKENHKGILQETKALELIVDYQWKISQIKSYKNNLENTKFSKNESIQIGFESTNATVYEPKTVKISGKEYPLSKVDSKYFATLDGISKAGEKEFVVEEVTLDNGKKFILEKDNKIEVIIQQQKPEISNVQLQEDTDKRKIIADFAISDPDNILKEGFIVLYDENDHELERKVIKTGKNHIEFTSSNATKYKVRIIASYQIFGELESIENVLDEKELEAQPYVKIKSLDVDKLYVEKGEPIQLQVILDTNIQKNVKRIRVNNLDCLVSKIEENRYQVTYNVSTQSGGQTLQCSKIIFDDDTEMDLDKNIQIDVLKDIPSIQHYKQVDHLDTGKVDLSFEVKDEDSAFINGKAVLKKEEDGSAQSQKINIGKNELTFSVEEEKAYTLEIVTTYDRDSNYLTGQDPDINKVTDECIFTQSVKMIGDYQLQISNMSAFKAENRESYFNKNEAVTIRFESSNVTTFEPEKVEINGKKYSVNKKENGYQVVVDGFDKAGTKDIKIERVILSNGKELTVSKNNHLVVEILKETPQVIDFAYFEKTNKIDLDFKLLDDEDAFKSGQVIISDENQVIKTEAIKKGKNTITFDKQAVESYFIKVIANYDLDSNALGSGDNEYTDKVLLEEEVLATVDRKIEMKDVLDVALFRKDANNTNYREVNSVSINYLNIEYYRNLYFVRVQMKDMPDLYAKIKGYRIDGKNFYLKLEYENATQYLSDGSQVNDLEVYYGDMSDDTTAEGSAFSKLLSEIKQNPTGTINLTRDYDASMFRGDKTSLAGADYEFKGTINGNGHKIYNLSAPLFDVLKGATIKDLTLENINIGNGVSSVAGEVSTSKKAALSNVVYSGTTIQNVHVKDMNLVTLARVSEYHGGLIGRCQGGVSTITVQDCSVTNLKIISNSNLASPASQVGGIAGLSQDTVIKNCYVEGEISGKAAIGGIVGEINANQDASMKNEIRNCISKVKINANSSGGGILGQGSSTVTLANNISLCVSGKGNRLFGWGNIKLEGKNISLNESALGENQDAHIENISKNDFSKEILKQLDFDENKWDYTSCSYDQLPALKNDDPSYKKKSQNKQTNFYIPDYELLKKRKDFSSNKELLYSNLYKLMPFYDSKYLVADGKKINEDHILNQKQLRTVVAFDSNKNIIKYLTEENYKNIKSIKVIFMDNTFQNYNVTYKYADSDDPNKVYGRVAMYKVDELGIEYTYDKYIVKQDAPIINKMIEVIKSIDYDKDLNSLEDFNVYNKRGYKVLKNYFDNYIRTDEKAREFVLNLVSSVDGYSVTQNNDILDWIIENKIKDNTQFKKILYAYNYYDRFYGVEMGGTSISNMFLFKPEMYRENISFQDVIDDFWNAEYKSTHVLNTEFRQNLSVLLQVSSPGELVERTLSVTTDYTDANDWFEDYFTKNNLLVEVAPKDYTDKVDYRAWTQLKKQPKYMMYILTLPRDSTFLVSTSGTFLVGSQMVYINDPTNQTQRQQLLDKMQSFGNSMANFYNNALGTIDVSYLNKYADIQIDNYSVNVYGTQESGKATDPFHINFNDLLNEWFEMQGASAYAIEGVVSYSVPTMNNYSIWSHEIGHNQSYKFFFKGNGFRPVGGNNVGNLGTEDYTDGHTTQGFGDGDVQWNLSYDFTPDRLVVSNLTQERINSVGKLDSYYKGMYEAIDFLDYIEAKAFLKLTPEEQAKVAVQIEYPNPNNRSSVTWKKITAAEFEKMNLKTVSDLWTNRITLRPGVTSSTTLSGDGTYGSEGMYIRRWYQPYNDNGRTHSWGFTYTTWQMLGIAGYENGYLNWFTGKSRNDLDAIQKITKDPSMTWEKFKKQRYQLMEESISTIDYLDTDNLIKEYTKALKTDAQNHDNNITASTKVRRINYHYLKRVTNDFRKNVLKGKSESIHISSAEQLKEEITKNVIGEGTNYYTGHYVLDNDIDLSVLSSNENALIEGYFMGSIDGNGHKLTGNQLPLFTNMKFARIYNLVIENSNITSGQSEKSGILSNMIEYSTIEKVIIQNSSLTANREVGALAGRLTQSLLQDVHVKDVHISGSARVGLLGGYIDASQISECSTNGEVTASGAASGGFAGEIVNKTVIENCYTIGRVLGTNDVGGFVGYVNDSTIENCFSNSRSEGKSGVASFVGQSIKNSTLKHNVTLTNQFIGYKFDGRTGSTLFVNYEGNYENQDNIGASTLERTDIDFTGKISTESQSVIYSEDFYKKTLGWSTHVWDLSKVTTGGIPKLFNLDPNDNSVSIETYHITSADDFISKMDANPYARFILDNDLDLSNYSSLITSEFRGILDGNNHTLMGNKVALFNKLNSATVKDLIIKESKINSSQGETGSLAKIAINSTIENVHIMDAIINEDKDKVGGLVGRIEETNIRNSSVQSIILSQGGKVGGFLGEAMHSIIENCYSTGKIQGYENVGGFLGFATDTTVKNSFSFASSKGVNNVAGFVGQATELSTFENNISLGNQNNHYKFDGGSSKDQFVNFRNNYEYDGNRGISNLTRDDVNFDGKITKASRNQITSNEFYSQILGWNETIWNFEDIKNVHTPKLIQLDPSDTKSIELYKANIGTVEEFINELQAHPDGDFTIIQDIDFADKEYEVGSVVISGIFDGTIKGNNHTIKNLKNATLFEQFNGEVKKLNMSMYNHGAAYYGDIYSQYVAPGQSNRTQSYVAAFAKQSFDAKYEDMKFEKITIFGENYVAGLVSKDSYSTISRVNMKQVYINSGSNKTVGNRSAILVGEKIGGSIENCYAQGDIITEGKQCGGIVGYLHEEASVDCTVANVYATNKSKENATTMGMFVGEVDATSSIKNSASIGLTASSTSSRLVGKFYGVAATVSQIKNCYENSSKDGTSNAQGNQIIEVDNEQLKEGKFYIDNVGLDSSIWSLDTIEERKYIESVNFYGSGSDDAPEMIFLGLK